MNLDTSFSGLYQTKKPKTKKMNKIEDEHTKDTGHLTTPTSPLVMDRGFDKELDIPAELNKVETKSTPYSYHHSYISTSITYDTKTNISNDTKTNISNDTKTNTSVDKDTQEDIAHNSSLLESVCLTDNNTTPTISNILDIDIKERKETTKPSVYHVDILKRNMEIPPYVLDPLSVIVKLAVLSKKPIGSKLSIDSNIIYINEPGFFQSFVRFVFKKNKYDLHFLFNPIEMACSKYLNDKVKITSNPVTNMNSDFGSDNKDNVSDPTQLDENCDPMVSLFKSAVTGLYMLVKTYEKENILTHTLYFYISIIMSHLGKNYNKELFIRDSNTDVYDEFLLKKMDEIWTIDRVNYMLNTFSFIQKSNDSDSTTKNVKCLEEFMKQIDGYVSSAIQVMNAKASEDEEKKEL